LSLAVPLGILSEELEKKKERSAKDAKNAKFFDCVEFIWPGCKTKDIIE